MSVDTNFYGDTEARWSKSGNIDLDEAVELPDGVVTETDDEYGGWIIDLSKMPKNVTHVYVVRF